MKLTLHGHDDRYAVEQLQLSLFPDNTEGEAVSSLHRGKVWLTAVTKITVNGTTAAATRRIKAADETVRLRRRALQQSYYLAAKQLLPVTPPWGALAGVRPTKITTKHLLEGGTPKSADKLLRDVYYVTDDRRRLAVDCSVSTVRAVNLLQPSDLSLYVGIPFCPTRCTYCSFVSRTIGRKTELLEPYLRALEQEIAVTGRLLAQSGRTVRTLYIGGGTPTTLSAPQMERLLRVIRDNFDLSRCVEFTVEGGRPDTLDLEELQVIRSGGADRMSINPQTMEDAVLRACGRPHKAADVLRAYGEAADAGFSAINMDLIAGLPADSTAGFRRSLDAVATLNPANITVHTLAEGKPQGLFDSLPSSLPPLTKAYRIHSKAARVGFTWPEDEEVEQQVEAEWLEWLDASAGDDAEMVAYAEQTLRALGYKPYYLYRQKYMSGSFENVGWSRDNLDCLYNIYMMEEVHTILSLGGGGMNKVNLPDGTLRRFHNPKFPEQYIEMLPGVLEQKQELFRLMADGK